jgi:hypothetical protein
MLALEEGALAGCCLLMRECQQCGEQNQAVARFCVVCGAPLSDAAAPASLPPPPALGLPPPPLVAPAAPIQPAAAAPGSTGRPSPSAGAQVAAARSAPFEFPLDGPRTLVGFLVSFDNVDIGQYWPLHQGRNVVGRQGAATGLDIEIAHPTTSSLHAVLLAAAAPARVAVEDTSSTNGTFVNDNLLAPGQRWDLRDGDRLRFGLFNTIVKVIQP